MATRVARQTKVPDEVLTVLANAAVDGGVLKLPTSLERGLYLAVNKVLTGIGGKWDRRANGHVFAGVEVGEVRDRLDALLSTGRFVSWRDLGQFMTPPALAARVVELAKLEPGLAVLEPSAGSGSLAFEAQAIVGERNVWAVESDPRFIQPLVDRLGALNVVQADFLSWLDGYYVQPFDRVVMNPPFAGQQDIAHVLHAWDLLNPGGRLVAITACGWVFRRDRRATEFREFVKANGYYEDNDPDAFAESGTSARTVTVCLRKPAA